MNGINWKSVVVALVICLALAVTGCGGNKQDGVFQSGGSLSIMVFDRGDVPGVYGTSSDNHWTKWAQENFGKKNNINLTYFPVPRAEESNRLNTLMAAQDAPDIIYTYFDGLYYSYAMQGGLTDLNSLIEEYGPNIKSEIGEDILKKYGQIDGKQYAVPAKRAFQGLETTWIRRDWLEALEIPMPSTTEEYHKAIARIKKEDPGKVGADKITGLYINAGSLTNEDVQTYTMQICYSFLEEMSEEDFYTLPNLNKPGWKEGVRFLNTLFNEGLIDSEFALYNNIDKLKEGIANGTIASFSTLYPPSDAWYALADSNPDAKLEPINTFANKEGKYLKRLYEPRGIQIMVPVFSKNAENAVKYLNWLSDKDVGHTLWYGQKDIHHTVTEDGIAVMIPENDRGDAWKETPLLNVRDLGLIHSGSDYNGNMDLIIKERSYNHKSAGYSAIAQIQEKGLYLSLTDAVLPPYLDRPIISYGNTKGVLDNKFSDAMVSSIMAKPGDFDKVYDAKLQEYMKSGGQEVLEERRSVYQAMKQR